MNRDTADTRKNAMQRLDFRILLFSLDQFGRKGADSYIPKDELANLVSHTADVIKARIEGRQGYGAWFPNLKPFFDKSFGKGWREKDRSFWNSFDDKYGG